MSKKNFLIPCLPFFLLLFLFLPISALAKKGFEDEVQDFTVAARAFEGRYYDLARLKLEFFVEHYPHSEKFHEALLLLGRSYLELGRFTDSLKTLSRLTGAGVPQEGSEQALYWSGEAYVRLRDYQKARDIFRRLINRSSSPQILPYAYYSLAWSLQETEEFEKAAERYTQLFQHFPDHPLTEEARFRNLTCLLALKRVQELQEQLDQFLTVYPESKWKAQALYLRGELLTLKGDLQGAKAAYRDALSQAREEEVWREVATLNLGWVLYHLKEYEEAMLQFNTLSERGGPLQESSLFGQALTESARGESSKAIALLEDLLGRFPKGTFAVKAQLERAGLLYKLSRIPEAIETYRRVLDQTEEEPIRLEAFYGLGWAHLRRQAYDEAIEAFQQVAQRTPEVERRAQALCHIGDTYQEKGDFQKAIQTYTLVLKETPLALQADYAALQSGMTYVKAGQSKEAVEALETFLTQFPNSPFRAEGDYQLGMLYFNLGQFDLAHSHFEKVSDQSNRALYESSRFQVANCLYNLKRYPEALTLFQSLAKEAHPRVASLSQYEIGWCLYQMGKRTEAVNAFRHYLSQYPDSEIAPDVHFWLAEYYERLKNEKEVLKHLRKLVETFPLSPVADEALFRWGNLLAEKGKTDEARRRYDQLLTQYPNSPLRSQTFLEKATLLIEAGDLEGGRVTLEEALAQFPETNVGRLAAQQLGALFKEQGRYPEAIDSFRKAKTGDEYEPNAQIQYEIGTCYEAMGDLEKALSEYRIVSSSYPKSTYWVVRASLHSAQILERLGRWEEAVQTYETLAAWERLEEAGFARERLKLIRQQVAAQ